MRNGFLKAVFCFLVNPHYPRQPFLAELIFFLQRKFESLSGRLKVCHHLQDLGLTGQPVRMFGIQSHTL